jgi:hypothetical protein
MNPSAIHVDKQDGFPCRPAREMPGPVYVNAAPPPAASAKALGITCAFFGMLVVIGAIAGLSSGRLNIHIPAQALRGILSLGAGAALFFLGTVLLGKSGGRRI